jgi:hypothetical protein
MPYRMDLLLEVGPRDRRDRLAIELKVWRDGRADPAQQGLAQLDRYLARLNLETGWLVVFDRRAGVAAVEERTQAEQATTPGGRRVALVRA